MNRIIKTCALLVLMLCATPVVRAQQSQMERAYLKLAERFELRQKKDQNLPVDLQRYLSAYPYSTYQDEVYFMSGVLLVEKESYPKAIKEFGKITKPAMHLTRPHELDYHYYLGYAYVMNHAYGNAIKHFAPLTKDQRADNPYRTAATYYMGYCEYRRGSYTSALKHLREVESSYRNTVPYYIAQIHYAQHDYDEVIRMADDILVQGRHGDNDAELHRMLGEIYYGRQEYVQAQKHFEAYERTIRQINEDNKTKRDYKPRELERNDMYLTGMIAYKVQDYSSAIEHLRQVKHRQDTISESTYLTLGHIYISQGDIAQAKLNYGLAKDMRLTPTLSEEAAYNYALATYQSSSTIGDVSAFRTFMQDYPHSKYLPRIYALQCDAYMKSNDKPAALKVLDSIPDQSAKVRQTKQYLRYQLGVDAFMQGKMDQVLVWMDEVERYTRESDRYTTEALYWRAEAKYRLHDFAGCARDIESMGKRADYAASPNRVASVYLHGYTLFSQKLYPRSADAFKRYVKLADPNDRTTADALNRIGDCYFNARSFSDAISYYTQVMQRGATGSDYATFQRGYAYGLQHDYERKLADMNAVVAGYPKSDYVVRALYEMARAQIALNREGEAIKTYDRLLKSYAKNPQYGPKASLERAMLYRNIGDKEMAIKSYKSTINNYPTTEEAYTALSGLEALYVETNQIADYIKYAKSLKQMKIVTREDSLTFAAAENQYMQGSYTAAAATLDLYRSNYGAGSRYYTLATYYAADSYYRLGLKRDALRCYAELADMQGNPYIEEAWMRAAEIAYDEADYAVAKTYFQRLYEQGTTKDNRHIGALGMLRCAHYIDNNRETVEAAQLILEEPGVSDELRREALYCRAKAFFAERNYAKAIEDLRPICSEVRTYTGAEAKYLLAQAYYNQGRIDQAEEEVMSFTEMNTQHQYWLARAIILLSDIALVHDDSFQASQYLLALQTNYEQKDDIQTIVAERLQKIEASMPQEEEVETLLQPQEETMQTNDTDNE